jgi:plasmid stabilization system protein ParE
LIGSQKIGCAQRSRQSIGFSKAPIALAAFRMWGMSDERPGTFEWVVTGLPYIVVYRVNADDDVVEVIALVHGAQDRDP